jgi:hypothetical protein
MKTIIVIFLLFFPLSSKILIAQQPESIPAISKVIISDEIQLQLERSDESALSITKNEVGANCLIKTIENGTLTLKIKSGFGCKGKVIAHLSSPGLKEMEIRAKAEISTKNLMKGDSLKVIIRSGGKAYVDLDIKYLEADVAGWGLFQSEGYAIKQLIKLSSSGTFSGYKLEGEDVTIKAYSGGKGKICVTNELNAETGSNGYISYNCEPKKKNINAKGSAKIEPYTE